MPVDGVVVSGRSTVDDSALTSSALSSSLLLVVFVCR